MCINLHKNNYFNGFAEKQTRIEKTIQSVRSGGF